MHIRNAGDESLSRLLLRARRLRRRRTSHSDLKHRTHTCLPTTSWLPSWLPPLPAATGDSNASNWKWSPSPIHRYRNPTEYTSATPRAVPQPLHVRTFPILLLQRRLRPDSTATVDFAQAHSLRRPHTAGPTCCRATAFRPIRASPRRRPGPPYRTGLSHTSLPARPPAGRPVDYSSTPPPPPPRTTY